MKSRLIASVAICATAMLGMTGCAYFAPQTTKATFPYSPLGGINVPDSGAPLLVRSAVIVATPSGSVGNLVAAVINTTSTTHTLNIQVGSGGAAVHETLKVPGGAVSSLGENVDPIRIDGLNVKPGATVPVYFQSGNASGSTVQVQVMGGNDGYVRRYVPQPVATPDVVPTTPAPTVTP